MDFNENLKEYLDDSFILDLMKSLDLKRTNSLILNTNKITDEDFISLFPHVKKHPFMKHVYYFNKDEYEFGKSYLFINGAYYIMDASSLLISYYLPVKNNDLILDMCSAPGGKVISTSLVNKDKNINFVANDISYNRCLELSKNIEHLGLSNVLIINNDFSKIYTKYKECFNEIILDAPCSGSAMFRKNDKALLDWSIEKVNKLSLTQIDLLKMAIYMLKNDGYIMYSTCSFSYEENEKVILNVLNEFPEIEVMKLEDHESYYHTKELKEAIHLFPNLYEGEGQFLCLLHKKGDDINKNQHFKKKEQPKFKKYYESYNLDFKNEIIKDDDIYLNNINLDIKYFSLIRPGLHVGKVNKNIFTPSFHLAHFYKDPNEIKLNEDELIKYIHGEELNKTLPLKNGYYVVSYNNIQLGFIKYVNGRLKNLYPKGLRH